MTSNIILDSYGIQNNMWKIQLYIWDSSRIKAFSI